MAKILVWEKECKTNEKEVVTDRVRFDSNVAAATEVTRKKIKFKNCFMLIS